MSNNQKSSLNVYSANQTVSANGVIPLTSINKHTGCSISFESGGNIKLVKPGLYLVTVDATALEAAGDEGIVALGIYKDGVLIPGAAAASSVADSPAQTNLSITTLVGVKQPCCACQGVNPKEITVMNTGIKAMYANINVVVVKLA